MWRMKSVHERGPTEYLDAAMARIEQDEALRGRADATLRALEGEELFRTLFLCPQSPGFHAEGPWIKDHVRLALVTLFAIVEDKLHLIDIEEFRRLKGYEGEIDELEETIKERVATLETFVLCHDLGKPSTISFSARPGSRGDQLGFNLPLSHAWIDDTERDRAERFVKYRELFDSFAREHGNEVSGAVQAEFYLAYQIDIHHLGHAHAVARPDLRAMIEQVGGARRLTAEEIADVYQLTLHHMEVIEGSRESRMRGYARLVKSAERLGRDADDFLDLQLAALLLDAVCGSRRGSAHGAWHDASPIENFLRAEHDFAPWKKAEKEQKRQEVARQEERKRLQAAGLDGDSLLAVTGMQPGPEFGKLLQAVQAAARGEGYLPVLPKRASAELAERIQAFRAQV